MKQGPETIWLGILIAASIVLACTAIEEARKRGLEGGGQMSVFQTYSSRYCRIEGSNGEEINLNCESLAQFVDANGESCQNAKVKPERAYFPDQSLPIKLCRSFDRETRSKRSLVRFLAFADAGAGEDKSEGYQQIKVAKAMQAVCPPRAQDSSDDTAGCDFALVSGDLIYPHGIKSVWDDSLRDRFEAMYDSFKEFDFYLVPGNHDYHANVTAQVEYSYFSDRWRMLDRHYEIPSLPAWLKIYGLDTTAILGEHDAPKSFETQRDNVGSKLCDGGGWKILYGHHPSFSNGFHGGEDAMFSKLKEIHDACDFHIYLNGHDHHQEHIHTTDYDVFVQGAGGARVKSVAIKPKQDIPGNESIGRGNSRQRFAKTAHGFAVFEVSENELKVRFYDAGKWSYVEGQYQDEPKAEDFVYECVWPKDGTSGCVLSQVEDNEVWN